MKIHQVTQGSDAWIRLRAGLVTASEVDALISPTFKVRTGIGVDSYVYRKVAEKITGVPLDYGSSFSMDQGTIREPESLAWYEFTHNVSIQRVGFITNDAGNIGASPDGLIGDDTGIEAKNPRIDNHLRYMNEGILPPEYAAQVHFSMFVTGRPRWIFLSYSRQLPPFVLEVFRDEDIMAQFDQAIKGFIERFNSVMTRIQALKQDTQPKENTASVATDL
jgi:hypothetical protein